LRRRELNSVCDSAKNPMDQDHDEPTLADMLSDPVTLAVMHADGVDPRGLAATLSKMAGKLMHPPGPVDQKTRFAGSAIAKAVIPEREADVSVEPPENVTAGWSPRLLRNNLRLGSALVLLAFVSA
jgi:hypothetical protein